MNQTSPAPLSRPPIEVEVDKSIPKVVLLGFLGTVVAATLSFFFVQFLQGIASLWWVLGACLIFLVLAVLNAFFIKSSGKIVFIVFLESLALIAPLYYYVYPEPSFVLLGGAFLFLIFGATGIKQGKNILMNLLEIKFFSVSRGVTPKVVTGILIFMSAVFYVAAFERGDALQSLEKLVIKPLIQSTEPLLRLWIPDISLEKPFGEFIKKFTESRLESMQPDFMKYLPEVREGLVATASEEIKSSLEKSLGPINSQDTVAEVATKSFKRYFAGLPPQFQLGIEIAIAVLFFLTLRGLVVLFYWFINFCAFLVFRFLVLTNFAHIALEARSREFVILS